MNRVKIIGYWASRALATAPNLSLSQRLLRYYHHATYVIVIFSLDVVFWYSKVCWIYSVRHCIEFNRGRYLSR